MIKRGTTKGNDDNLKFYFFFTQNGIKYQIKDNMTIKELTEENALHFSTFSSTYLTAFYYFCMLCATI